MKYTVKYSYGLEWHIALETENIFEAKKMVKRLKEHFRLWNGKLGAKIKLERA